jgi:hypothetical protein
MARKVCGSLRRSFRTLSCWTCCYPKLGGQEVLQALKGDPLTARIPVIILGSLAQQNEEKLKKGGAAAYFEKAKLIEDDNSGKLNDPIATLCVNRDSESHTV